MLGSLPRSVDVNLLDTRGLLRRWWFWAGTLFILGAIGVGYILIPVDGSRISQANCDKIEVGWTMAQVCDLLGGPTWNTGSICWYEDKDGYLISISFDPAMSNGDILLAMADGKAILSILYRDEDGNSIFIHLDKDKRVTNKSFSPSELPVLERIKKRIERRLRISLP